MATKLTTSGWVAKATAIWGNNYDYSSVGYQDGRTPVSVRCKKKGHGAWSCHPGNHITKIEPRGCPKCGREKQRLTATKTFDNFVRDARRVHGRTYSYDRESYQGAKTKTAIKCVEHGIFLQTPDAHISQSSGCPKCASARKPFIRLLPEIDVDKLVRSLSGGNVRLVPGSYSGMNRRATFLCKEHGAFERLVTSAVVGANPCTQCSGGGKYARGHTTEEFAAILKSQFGSNYRVKPFKYIGKATKLTLICHSHGEFNLLARSIYRSSGCPQCAYQASSKVRRQALRRKAASTLDDRLARWMSDAKIVHGTKYDYSKVKYSDARTSVDIMCPVHGRFTQTPGKHLTSGCRKCAFDDFKGRYTDKYFRDFPERKKLPAKLYYVKFKYDFGVFYKVGITSTTIEQRFILVRKAGISMSIIKLLNTSLHRAFRLEQELQQTYGTRSRYRPKLNEQLLRTIRIGPSECFAKPLPKSVLMKVFD